ncbi:hypothetical protein GCM10007989_29780 [Devosia pacifica]|uniref:Yip1 domain-containing protein n=1 Tax=Devosia pacifica TaxID=1335967 RepID=A0A918VWM6_9HYPH|nr:hypothetical protein [Devosia pacifica]GHA31757.1 hypothetical protein GCM10007989_29780 [Devosia pacifica]
MKLAATLIGAVRGWGALLSNAQWRQHFNLTSAGFVAALAIYFLFAFLALSLGGLATGGTSTHALVIGLAVFGLYPCALVIATFGFRILLRRGAPVLDLLVPGTYALVFHLLLGGLLSLVGPPLVIIAVVFTGFLLVRLALAASGWPAPASVGYGVFTCVLLVGMPVTLYMLADTFTASF